MERNLFLWILIGLVVGAVARQALPGREPGGFILSLLLGLAGALAGGFGLIAFGSAAPTIGWSVAGATGGSVAFVLIYRIVVRTRTR